MLGSLAKRFVPKPLWADWVKETHINRALRSLNGRTYLEIGVRNGECFRQIIAPCKIGVDPDRQDFGKELPNESFYENESDEFFAQHADHLFTKQNIDVALVDGLHEFRQALRDVLNVERYISPNGIIFIHDLNPATRKLAEVRDGGAWNGDVWKIAYYLRKFRPDLHFFTLNCDFGLGVLTGFGRSQRKDSCLQAIIDECKNLDYSVLERNRRTLLNLKPCWYSRFFFQTSNPQHSYQRFR